jgi:hypothetical protein
MKAKHVDSKEALRYISGITQICSARINLKIQPL